MAAGSSNVLPWIQITEWGMGKRVEVIAYKEISLELVFGAGNQTAQELSFIQICADRKKVIFQKMN